VHLWALESEINDDNNPDTQDWGGLEGGIGGLLITTIAVQVFDNAVLAYKPDGVSSHASSRDRKFFAAPMLFASSALSGVGVTGRF